MGPSPSAIGAERKVRTGSSPLAASSLSSELILLPVCVLLTSWGDREECLRMQLPCGAPRDVHVGQSLMLWRSQYPVSVGGFPWWLSGKESSCQCKRHEFDPWVRKIPWRRKWQPTPVFLPGKSQGQRSLMGYSPWGHERVRHGLAINDNKKVGAEGASPSSGS